MKKIKTFFFVSIIALLAFSPLTPVKELSASRMSVFENGQVGEVVKSLAGADFVRDEIIVKYKNDNQAFRILKVPHGRVAERLGELSKRSDVEFAEPNYIAQAYFTPNDSLYSYQWNFNSHNGINIEKAWDLSFGSNEVVVAVIDTGIAYEKLRQGRTVYYQAPDLSDACFVGGYDFINSDSYPNDDNGHGTHVAGTIAQNTNNGTGVAGVSPDVCLMPIKALDSSGSGSYTAIASAIRYAADKGADIINMSLGGENYSSVLEDAVAYAHSKGVLIVAAAGNSNTSVPHYPASYDDYVISVGATDYNGNRAPYSNYGDSLDIVAPGGSSADNNGDGQPDGILQQTFVAPNYGSFGYYFSSGTSMAAPHVAGTAALLKSYALEMGQNLSNASIRTILESSARDLGQPGLDIEYGHGLLDAYAALSSIQPALNADPIIEDILISGNMKGEQISFSALASDSDGDTLSYAWNFGDGNTGQGEIVYHSYSSKGDYELQLTVSDGRGGIAQTSRLLTIIGDNEAPQAVISGGDKNGEVGSEIFFDGSESFDSDGSIVSYVWDFGDGSTANGQTVAYVYANEGTYTAVLTVTDNEGLSNSVSIFVNIFSVNQDGIELGANAYKLRGLPKVDLSWSGADTAYVQIRREGSDGLFIVTTSNNGFYTDTLNRRSQGVYYYTLCEYQGGKCSARVSVEF